MVSQVYNLLWIPRELPAEFSPGKTSYQPFPREYFDNALAIAALNPDVEVHLWIDSSRMDATTKRILENDLKKAGDEGRHPGNIVVRDLQEIPDYKHGIFNQRAPQEELINWRNDPQKNSLIWRQIDLAKILICKQGNYDQVFFSDLDCTNFKVNSPDVQAAMTKHGMVLGGEIDPTTTEETLENQLLGFDNRTRRGFLELLFKEAMKDADPRIRKEYADIPAAFFEDKPDSSGTERLSHSPSAG